MTKEVDDIIIENQNIIQAAKLAVLTTKRCMTDLKSYVLAHPFESPEEEVHFFKTIKPRFYACMLYYSRLYQIELDKPVGGHESVKSYFIEEIKKINCFFEDNKEFYRYLRSGATYFDQVYFVRENQNDTVLHDSLSLQWDTQFSTAYDYKLARIESDKMLCDYFMEAIQIPKSNEDNRQTKNKLQWTAQKSGLVELLYALHASGVFNNSPLEIKTVANYFSEVFDISLGNIYKTYEEIRLRKKNRTSFLDSLRNNLLRKMEEDD
ncbi:MAG TPA: RteC domain-containing protein [Puia sp.]|nr:RteC domain-containing protein [Puia sp.]